MEVRRIQNYNGLIGNYDHMRTFEGAGLTENERAIMETNLLLPLFGIDATRS